MPKNAMSKSEQKLRSSNPTLTSRSVYGPYKLGLQTRSKIIAAMEAAHKKVHGKAIPEIHRQAIWDIANKLSRIAVCPDHLDSWHDIVGYGSLIENMLKEDS